ncbi:Hypothetical predicted protein [Cloeon dipterum]|nr:Hypothetical predicted protein [Cloeon dipterum]
MKSVPCSERLGFVCSLPEICHADVCASTCLADENSTQCMSSAPSSIEEDCIPECKQTDCANEGGDKFGFRGKKELLSMCDKSLHISKETFRFGGANLYCCVKHMQLLNIASLETKSCLSKQLNLSASEQFWTSGRAEICNKTYAWCGSGEKEEIDFDILGWKKPESSAGRGCIVANFEKTGSFTEIKAKYEDCQTKNKYRVICERDPPSKCTNTRCPMLRCEEEKHQTKGIDVTRLSNVKVWKSKGKEIRADVNKLSYYIFQKYGCAANFPILSLESKNKMDFVIKLIRSEPSKLPFGKYFLSAVSIGCPSVIRWCNWKDNPLLENDSYLSWDKGEPSADPSKECVAVDYSDKPPYFTLFKIECNAAGISVLAESSENCTTTSCSYLKGL